MRCLSFFYSLFFHKVKHFSMLRDLSPFLVVFQSFHLRYLSLLRFTNYTNPLSVYTGVVFLFSVLELLSRSPFPSLSSVPIPRSRSTVEEEKGGGWEDGTELLSGALELEEFWTAEGLWDLSEGSVPLIIMPPPPPPLSFGKQLCSWYSVARSTVPYSGGAPSPPKPPSLGSRERV